MEFLTQSIPDLKLIVPRIFADNRGYFFESYRKDSFLEQVGDVSFCQDNESQSGKHILRGLHFQQPPYAQDKLVQVIKGAVLDVAVDIRKNSKTYGQHVSAILSEQNKHQLFIPKGFAHGFLTLEDHTIFQYKCSDYYNKESEGGLAWDDPDLDIDWKIANPVLSEKDLVNPSFKSFESPF